MNTTPKGLHVVRDRPAVAPAVLLDQVAAFLARFSVLPDQHCAPTLALWYAHTHAVQHFYTTPRLILDSAEPGSGKTRVLEVAQHLVAKPEMTISITTAAIFRMLADGPITLLFDEIDTIFSAKAGGNNEDLRGLLNSGYKRSATVSRCVGDASRMRVERFPVFAPVALAGIAGAMPATITTRAITIHMRRRAPHERAEPFRERKVAQARPRRCANSSPTGSTGWAPISSPGPNPPCPPPSPTAPPRYGNRSSPSPTSPAAHWPATARAAAAHFVDQAATTGASIGTRLLADLRALFHERDTDRMATTEILSQLADLEEVVLGRPRRPPPRPPPARPRTRPLRRPTRPPAHRRDRTKGYQIDGPAGLADAWARYLPPVTDDPPPGAVTPVTAVTPQVRPVTAAGPVTATDGYTPCRAPSTRAVETGRRNRCTGYARRPRLRP